MTTRKKAIDVTRKKAIDVTRESGNTMPAWIIKPTPAVFVPPPKIDDNDNTNVLIPESVTNEFDLEEAPTGMSDTVEFPKVGSFVFGIFRGSRTLEIGDRTQILHDIEVDGSIKGVWGSTILDQRIMRLNPQIGEWIYVQYYGDVETKRKLSPAKIFRVARMKVKK